VECPACGAPLVIHGRERGLLRCQFCGATIQPPEPPTESMIFTPASPPRPSFDRTAEAPAGRSRPVLGWLIGAAVILGIGIAVYLAAAPDAPDNPLRPPLYVHDVAVLRSADPQSPPDFIAMAFDITADQYRFARLNGKDSSVLWRGEGFESISEYRGLAAADDMFFSTRDANLTAFRALDGSFQWSTGLADNLGYCSGCLSVTGDRVIVLTQDYTLQAFDTITGEPAWSRRMAGYTPGFQIWDGNVLVIDKNGDSYTLFYLDIASGNELHRIDASCTMEDSFYSGDLGPNSTVFLAPNPGDSNSGSVYLIYGWPYGCVERRDLTSGNRIWQTARTDGFSPSGDAYPLSTPDTLYFGFDDTLMAADLADGTLRTVLQAPDNDILPLFLADGVLVVRAKTTRGSTRFSLWGIDPVYGERLWEHPLGNSAPIDPPDPASGLIDDDQSAFTWRFSDGRFLLLTFRAMPNEAFIQEVNLEDGTFSDGSTVNLNISGDSYSVPEVLEWHDPIIRVGMGNGILGFNFETGEIEFAYP
jgi:outer membrane protein assembly factor BamB